MQRMRLIGGRAGHTIVVGATRLVARSGLRVIAATSQLPVDGVSLSLAFGDRTARVDRSNGLRGAAQQPGDPGAPAHLGAGRLGDLEGSLRRPDRQPRPARFDHLGFAAYGPAPTSSCRRSPAAPGSRCPARCSRAIFAQESNYNQASWHATAGVPAIP